MTNVLVVTRSRLSQACRDALDLAWRNSNQLQAGSVLIVDRVYWTSVGTVRRLVKLGLAAPKLELQASDIVDGRIPFTVLLTEDGIFLAKELAEDRPYAALAGAEDEEDTTRPVAVQQTMALARERGDWAQWLRIARGRSA